MLDRPTPPSSNGLPAGQPDLLLGTDAEQIANAIALATLDDAGDVHVLTGFETPLRPDAFEMDDPQKIEIITEHFRAIMHTLGLDLTDDSLKGTPRRVAKMYVQEIFRGLNPKHRPTVTMFENRYAYSEMLIERDITLYSHCEHHFVPIIGKVHVAYFSSGKVVGLSKINRIVQYYAKRPQVQERLTVQIGEELKRSLATDDVAVMIDATHLCVSSRGINDTNTSTITNFFSGRFEEETTRQQFVFAVKG
jgi:GTP cyclohydrolase I